MCATLRFSLGQVQHVLNGHDRCRWQWSMDQGCRVEDRRWPGYVVLSECSAPPDSSRHSHHHHCPHRRQLPYQRSLDDCTDMLDYMLDYSMTWMLKFSHVHHGQGCSMDKVAMSRTEDDLVMLCPLNTMLHQIAVNTNITVGILTALSLHTNVHSHRNVKTARKKASLMKYMYKIMAINT